MPRSVAKADAVQTVLRKGDSRCVLANRTTSNTKTLAYTSMSGTHVYCLARDGLEVRGCCLQEQRTLTTNQMSKSIPQDRRWILVRRLVAPAPEIVEDWMDLFPVKSTLMAQVARSPCKLERVVLTGC